LILAAIRFPPVVALTPQQELGSEILLMHFSVAVASVGRGHVNVGVKMP
jgi:hypothetical protein